MPGGRPTKLTEDVRQKIAEYYTECVLSGEVPTAAQLAVILDISKKTLYNWADNDAELLHTLEQIQTLQEATLVKGSLKNLLNPTISKLMLANHGYREKSDTDITSGGEKLGVTLSADQTEQLLRARANRSDI